MHCCESKNYNLHQLLTKLLTSFGIVFGQFVDSYRPALVSFWPVFGQHRPIIDQILANFFYRLLTNFLASYWPILTSFSPVFCKFLVSLWPVLASFGQFLASFWPVLASFGQFLASFGQLLASFWSVLARC